MNSSRLVSEYARYRLSVAARIDAAKRHCGLTEQPGRIAAPFLDVLATFIAAGGEELHGWAIIKASKRGGPTVYKILERLNGMG